MRLIQQSLSARQDIVGEYQIIPLKRGPFSLLSWHKPKSFEDYKDRPTPLQPEAHAPKPIIKKWPVPAMFAGSEKPAISPPRSAERVARGRSFFSFSNSSILRPRPPINITARLLNSETDVYWADVFRLDTVLRRKKTTFGFDVPKIDTPLRGKIDHFSRKSRLRLKHQVRNAPLLVRSQFVLTYPDGYPLSGKIIKNHLDRWFRAIHKAYGTSSFGYEWCLEFQKRGAPHFHVYFTWPPSNELRRFLAKKWNSIVKGGVKHLRVHLRVRNFAKWDMGKGNYVMKYAQKAEQKNVPTCFSDVGRFWGCSRNMIPVATRYEFGKLLDGSLVGWTEETIRIYFNRIMRRFHDSQLRMFGKSSFLGSPCWSRVNVPNASVVFRRLLAWVQWEGPNPGDTKYRVPLCSGPVPF